MRQLDPLNVFLPRPFDSKTRPNTNKNLAIRPCMDTLACELTHIHTQQAIRKPSYNPSSQELVDVAKSFLERRKERMTERQMLRGLRGISVFLTLIHWHISVS